MRTTVVSFLIVLLFVPSLVAYAGEDEGGGAPDLPNFPNAAIDALATQLPLVHALYFYEHSRFWQGLKTPATTPTQGESIAPDLSLAADGDDSWADVGIVLSDTVDYSLSVGVVQFEDGWGYTIACEFYYQEQLWRTVRTYNQDNMVGHGWMIVEED